jgi:UDP-2-acetamido-2,6-beta-L-arabino-hexul-4-ose reductase
LKIAVTGANGLLGWHLRCRLASLPDTAVVAGGREIFEDDDAFDAFVAGADVVVHLAGVNRGPEREVEEGNVALAEKLVRGLARDDAAPSVIFSSSIHIDRPSPYGRSKRKAGEILQAWARRRGARFVNLVLPHVFGERGRPFYNSVVSTFCHQIATGEAREVRDDADLSLLHAQDVADIVVEHAASSASGDVRVDGWPTTVRQLLTRLENLAESYDSGVVPDIRQPIDLALFNTYRSYLYPARYPVDVALRTDARGSLFEAVKSLNGGQTFLSTTRPGITRGNHYHRRKVERFLVVSGQAEIRVRRLFDEQIVSFRLSGDRPQFIDIPTLHTHDITNVGADDLLTLFWANEIFDPSRPDTEAQQV